MSSTQPFIHRRFSRANGHSRAIGPLGTTARALVGLGLLALTVIGAGDPLAWWQLVLGLVGLPAMVAAVQLVLVRSSNRQLNQTDHRASCLNCAVLAALLYPSATRGATLLFLSASMLIAASRGYGGCESLAISNWLLRRDDQVGCMVFSPLDRIEAR